MQVVKLSSYNTDYTVVLMMTYVRGNMQEQ
jgi:hypothetical protein